MAGSSFCVPVTHSVAVTVWGISIYHFGESSPCANVVTLIVQMRKLEERNHENHPKWIHFFSESHTEPHTCYMAFFISLLHNNIIFIM